MIPWTGGKMNNLWISDKELWNNVASRHIILRAFGCLICLDILIQCPEMIHRPCWSHDDDNFCLTAGHLKFSLYDGSGCNFCFWKNLVWKAVAISCSKAITLRHFGGFWVLIQNWVTEASPESCFLTRLFLNCGWALLITVKGYLVD